MIHYFNISKTVPGVTENKILLLLAPTLADKFQLSAAMHSEPWDASGIL